jgi:hypothetical protein
MIHSSCCPGRILSPGTGPPPACLRCSGQPSFLIDRQITNRWDTFIEYAGDFPQSGTPQHLLHLGTALKISSNQQFDFSVGFGLSSAAVDHFVGVGYSFQYPALHLAKHNRSWY